MEDLMRIEKKIMDEDDMKSLKEISLAPYIYIASQLIKKKRKAGGSMFRHQMDTLAILIEYNYLDPILLKAAVIHDTVEDLKDFDTTIIAKTDNDGEQVLKLVLEVTKQPCETKEVFLKRILEHGSYNAKLLKVADRISNLIQLGFVTQYDFIERTCDDTEYFILPMALLIDFNMYQEIISLIETRKKVLEIMDFNTISKK